MVQMMDCSHGIITKVTELKGLLRTVSSNVQPKTISPMHEDVLGGIWFDIEFKNLCKLYSKKFSGIR